MIYYSSRLSSLTDRLGTYSAIHCDSASSLVIVSVTNSVMSSTGVSARVGDGADIVLQCENLQRTGSFKIRGAVHCVSLLTPQERLRGVAALVARERGNIVTILHNRLNPHLAKATPRSAWTR